MRSSYRAAHVRMALAASVLAAAGCSADTAALGAAAAGHARDASSVVTAQTATAALAVTDSVANHVTVFASSGELLATIAGFESTTGIAVGAGEARIVADFQAQRVLVYANDNVTLKATLADTGAAPASVAYDAVSGTVAALNQGTAQRPGGSVALFARGTTVPCATLADPHWTTVLFGAFDHAGNLYIDGTNYTRPLIGVVKGECAASGITTLHVANTIGYPGGMGVTPAGRIAVLDQYARSIYTYDAPAGTALGEPVATTPLNGALEISTFAFTASGAQLWTADAGAKAALKYAYPAGGNPLATIATGTSSEPYGIAAIPPERP